MTWSCRRCAGTKRRKSGISASGKQKWVCASCHTRAVTKQLHDQPEMMLLEKARMRSRKRGTPFHLTRAAVWRLLRDKRCAYCRQAVDHFHGQGVRPNSATLDCIDPQFGYVWGNVALACHRCNMRKQDYTPDTLRRWAEQIESLADHLITTCGPMPE